MYKLYGWSHSKPKFQLAVEGEYYLQKEKRKISAENQKAKHKSKLRVVDDGWRGVSRISTEERHLSDTPWFEMWTDILLPRSLLMDNGLLYYRNTIPRTCRDRETMVYRFFRWWTVRGRPNNRQWRFSLISLPKTSNVVYHGGQCPQLHVHLAQACRLKFCKWQCLF